VTWQVLFFLPRVAGFQQPRSHMTWAVEEGFSNKRKLLFFQKGETVRALYLYSYIIDTEFQLIRNYLRLNY
jgi:hypothetical protein